MSGPAGILAVRAVNEYRRRDFLAYIGLRYYLDSQCATKDEWSRVAASSLVSGREVPAYLSVSHYKDRVEVAFSHREIHIPGPNEAMAEVALLDACSCAGESFQSLPCVYSYRLATGNFKGGTFRPYLEGFREKQAALRSACRELEGGRVLITDIRKFYPNIPAKVARRAWQSACANSALKPEFCLLGNRLLELQAAAPAKDCKAVLTGPLFSHLIANLVLRDLDQEMTSAFPGRYFRYVDDIVLVGSESHVRRGRQRLREILGDLELTLHDAEKDYEYSTSDHSPGPPAFASEEEKVSWKTFAGDLKRFLLARPEQTEELAKAFLDNDLRVPLMDYGVAARDSDFLGRLKIYAKYAFVRRRLQKTTVKSLVEDAIILRERFVSEVPAAVQQLAGKKHHHRKPMVSYLRFLAKRLVFLGRTEDLFEVGKALAPFPELSLNSEICSAIAMRDVSVILQLGVDAAQAVAQVLKLSNAPVKCDVERWGENERQARSLFAFNGIDIPIPDALQKAEDGLHSIANWQPESRNLMQSSDPFIRELACLHGIDEGRRHEAIVKKAFDVDEELAFDAIQQLRQSYSP